MRVAAGEAVVVEVTINGQIRSAGVTPRTLLSDYIRDHLGLKGTNIGCEHGYCGACTVLMDSRPVRSCLVLAPQADGSAITTVEGLSNDGELSTLQQAFQQAHGLQCGYCTPGLLVTATALLEDTDAPLTDDQIREAIAGNICRCTGYVHIVDAIRSAAESRTS